jgi:hypothetical protein
MTPDELRIAGIVLNNGRSWGWQVRLAETLKVDGSTVRRWQAGTVPVPGPVEVAIKCLIERKARLIHEQ